MTDFNNLFSTDVSSRVMSKLSSMDKTGISRTVRYLQQLLKDKKISKIYDSTQQLQSKGVLPKGKYIGEAPFRGEENILHLWTGGMPTGDVSTFSRRGVSPSLVVEKSPIKGGLYSSPEKHKATMQLYSDVAKHKDLPEDFLPFYARRTPNPMEANKSPEYADRIFQPFVPQASDFQKSEAAEFAAPLFRRGKLNKIAPEFSDIDKMEDMVRSGKVSPSTLDITDLKPDNFVAYNGRIQLADATPSKDIYSSALAKRISEANPLSTRHAVRTGRILNPGLFMEGTPAEAITSKVVSQLHRPIMTDIYNNPRSAYNIFSSLPVAPGDVISSAGTNTRVLQNILYSMRNSGGSRAFGAIPPLKSVIKELRKGARPSATLAAIPSIEKSLTPEERKLLLSYMGRKVGLKSNTSDSLADMILKLSE